MLPKPFPLSVNHSIDILTVDLGVYSSQGIVHHTTTDYAFKKHVVYDLPSLYWIAKLNRCPYIQRYIVGDGKCSTKLLSKLLTSIHSCSCQDGYSTT